MNILDEYLDKLQEFDPIVLAGLSAANLIIASAKLYKQYFTKAARQCSDLQPREKALCMVRGKMLAKNAQLKILSSDMTKCQKVKNPLKCKEKLSGKMQKLSAEIKFLSDRFKEVKQQNYSK